MSTNKVAVLVGSLRREAFSRKMAHVLIGLAPAALQLEIVEIGDLPLYNQDLEKEVPPAWSVFRERMRGVQAVLFVTPEYNRSVPGGLKNALDVGSRPYGKSVWGGKACAIASVSPGANHHLRQSLVFLDMPAMQQPEAYLGGADKLLDATGKLVSPSTQEFLAKFMETFAAWVSLHGAQ